MVGAVRPGEQHHRAVGVKGLTTETRKLGKATPRPLVELRRLAEEQWPPGVSVERDSYVFPVTGFGKLYGAKLLVKRVFAPKEHDRPPVAEIEIRLRGKSDSETVRVGDHVRIADFAHKVRNIVPPDPKDQVIGWVELSPLPANDADGKDAGGSESRSAGERSK